MQIDFLYFEDCPSHDVALERLKQVMAEEHIDVPITIIQVETDEQAQTEKFIGSPTIRINGADIVPPPSDSGYFLACRVYQLEDGRFSPLPSLKMIRTGLQQAVEA